jgi:3-oxoacyl-[acyl-carrier protein] reductase
VLVVNHARSGLGRLDELTAEHLDAFLHENVRASLLLVREFASQFEGEEGRVVLITSGAHLAPMTREVAYAVSKGALAVATATLADELAERGITVNCVNPGPTDTGWGLAEVDPGLRMPFGRWGEPDDAARLVAWLASPDARWITGQVIDSEGGFRRFA